MSGRFFDALIVTGAPVERLPFEEVAYWPELTEILEWSRTLFPAAWHLLGAQALLYHFHNVPKYDCGKKLFGVYPHRLNDVNGRLMRGFTDSFPMPVSRYTENREVGSRAGRYRGARRRHCGIGLARDPSSGDLFVLNHLEYDAETLEASITGTVSRGWTRRSARIFPGRRS